MAKKQTFILISHKKWKNEYLKKCYAIIDNAFEEMENSKRNNNKEKIRNENC